MLECERSCSGAACCATTREAFLLRVLHSPSQAQADHGIFSVAASSAAFPIGSQDCALGIVRRTLRYSFLPPHLFSAGLLVLRPALWLKEASRFSSFRGCLGQMISQWRSDEYVSTQTSMAAPVNCDRPQRSTQGKRGRIYCLRAKEPTPSASGVEGSSCKSDPSPRLRLGTFNGWRPTREEPSRQWSRRATRFPFPLPPRTIGEQKRKSDFFETR